MQLDPATIIAAAALGEVGKGLVKGLYQTGKDWLDELFGGEGTDAAERAGQNVHDFLLQVAVRIGKLEQEAATNEQLRHRLAGAQRDPDLLAGMKTALLSAGRSSDPYKRELLSSVVAARIAADPDTTEALAANMAVEAVPRLTAADLDLLGVIGLTFGVRPVASVPETPVPLESNEPLQGYALWLQHILESLEGGFNVDESQIIHLSSAMLCSIHWGISRDLLSALTESMPVPESSRGSAMVQVNRLLGETRVGRQVRQAWSDGLDSVTLTPAGLTIAATVVEIRGGKSVHIHWPRGSMGLRRAMENSLPWARGRLNRDFVEELDREFARRLQDARRAAGIPPSN